MQHKSLLYAGKAEKLLCGAFLFLTLALSGLFGYLAPYLILLTVIGFVAVLAAQRDMRLHDKGPVIAFCIFFAVLAVCFAFSAKQPSDVIFAFNFIALPSLAPIAVVLRRSAKPDNIVRVAQLCLAGALICALMAILEIYVMGRVRAGYISSNANRFAYTAILLGFFSLPGFLQDKSDRRWMYLAGPVFGLITMQLSGTRGALVAAIPMFAVSFAFYVRSWRTFTSAGLVVLIGLIGAAFYFTGPGAARFTSIVDIAQQVLSGHTVTDLASAIRLGMYKAAFAAFLDNPWHGYGWAHLMASIGPYLPPESISYVEQPHLHNDFADFAVAAGMPGLLVYAGLIVSPVWFAARSVRDSQYRARLFGTCLLSTGYFFLGLTGLMFGHEVHTVMFAAMTGIWLYYCKDQPDPGTLKRD